MRCEFLYVDYFFFGGQSRERHKVVVQTRSLLNPQTWKQHSIGTEPLTIT